MNAWSDHGKVKRVFGDAPATPLVEGLARMAAWARSTGARQSKAFGHIEITEKLSFFWSKQG